MRLQGLAASARRGGAFRSPTAESLMGLRLRMGWDFSTTTMSLISFEPVRSPRICFAGRL